MIQSYLNYQPGVKKGRSRSYKRSYFPADFAGIIFDFTVDLFTFWYLKVSQVDKIQITKIEQSSPFLGYRKETIFIHIWYLNPEDTKLLASTLTTSWSNQIYWTMSFGSLAVMTQTRSLNLSSKPDFMER